MATKQIQHGQDANTGTGWQTITFPTPFTNVPVVVATPEKINLGSGSFTVEVRNATLNDFEARASFTSGGGAGGDHPSTTDLIAWIALAD